MHVGPTYQLSDCRENGDHGGAAYRVFRESAHWLVRDNWQRETFKPKTAWRLLCISPTWMKYSQAALSSSHWSQIKPFHSLSLPEEWWLRASSQRSNKATEYKMSSENMQKCLYKWISLLETNTFTAIPKSPRIAISVLPLCNLLYLVLLLSHNLG